MAWCLLGQGLTQKALLFGCFGSIVGWAIFANAGPGWILLLPACALVAAVMPLGRGLRAVTTLSQGILINAQVVEVRRSAVQLPTGRGGGAWLYHVTYEFESANGNRDQLEHSVLGPNPPEPGDTAEAVYMAKDPKQVFLTSSFGQGMRVTDDTVDTQRKVVPVLILPVLFGLINIFALTVV